jgi:hypothetical protein
MHCVASSTVISGSGCSAAGFSTHTSTNALDFTIVSVCATFAQASM